MEQQERIAYLDVLRVISIFAVIILHVAGLNFKTITNPYNWEITNIWFGLFRWGVPVFVMISGVLFLNPAREIPLRKLYTKYIFHLACVLVSWSVIYAFVSLITEPGQNAITVLRSIIAGPFHLWFLYMILGLYILVPLLRPICKDPKLMRYFLILCFVFSCLFPTLTQVLRGVKLAMPHSVIIPYLIDGINSTLYSKIHFHFTLEYVTYFVLGDYVSQVDLTPKQRNIIYILGIMGLLFPICFVSSITHKTGIPFDFYTSSEMNIFVLFATLAVFVFIKYNAVRLSDKLKKIFTYLAKYVLGIYLVHVLVLTCLIKCFNLLSVTLSPLFAIALIALLIFTLSLIIANIIKKIPILNKYII